MHVYGIVQRDVKNQTVNEANPEKRLSLELRGMTKEKYNENDNENRSLSENFRDDPFRGCGQPGGIDAGVRSAEHPALIAVGDC